MRGEEPSASIRISLGPAPSPDELGPLWRAIEERAECSFFQSWTYVGCLMKTRFPAAILLKARIDERIVGLALFNSHGGFLGGRGLFLNETGIASLDAIFVEHNGPVIARDARRILPQILKAALSLPVAPRKCGIGRTVVLSGVDDEALAAARTIGAVVSIRKERAAPAVDLAALRGAGSEGLNWLSANARYQIRRAERRFAESGVLAIRRAKNEAEGHLWLRGMARLHQRTWQSRGLPGAFADSGFCDFHHALIDRGLARGEVDLLRITAGERVIGYLLNFVFQGTVYAYQSGFDYALRHRHEKPGLVCHHLAVGMYLREGQTRYDFLSGSQRYKRSFASDVTSLYWLAIAQRWSLAGIAIRAEQMGGVLAAGLAGMRRHAAR